MDAAVVSPILSLDQKMVISSELLEKICKRTIETVLLCLEHATKGTIYRIGSLPRLQAVRITSGVRNEETGKIEWGLPEESDYNPPGKEWDQYRDDPGCLLEAMGWCVEQQKSWTSDQPYEDVRSVRKQLFGEVEDFFHMEPVLVPKGDLFGSRLHLLQYPLDWQGKPIWQDTDFVVVAVIKIHFLPYAMKRGDRSTKVIKMLSQTLGTEMLSLYLKESLLRGQRELSRKQLESCNVLAHELRNTSMKLNFAFRIVNAEIGSLREQWEMEVRKAFPDLDDKAALLKRLIELIGLELPKLGELEETALLARKLMAEQEQLYTLSLSPQDEEQWLTMRIEPKWERLLTESRAWDAHRSEIHRLLKGFRKAIWMGMDSELARNVTHLPEDLRTKWPKLVYTPFTVEKLSLLDDIVQLLQHPALNIPHKYYTKKVFMYLKMLVKVIPELEDRANAVIAYLRSGISWEDP